MNAIYMKVLFLLVILTLSGCQQLPQNIVSKQSHNSLSSSNDRASISNIYANPTQDANIAIALKDFRILAFSDNHLETLGISSNYNIKQIEQHCGIRVIPGTSYVSEKSLNAKKDAQIKQYVEAYNKVIFAGCQRYFGKLRNKRKVA